MSLEGLEVVAAVLALLVALGLAFQDCVLGEMAQFDRQPFVDLFRFGLRDHVIGHDCKVSPGDQ